MSRILSCGPGDRLVFDEAAEGAYQQYIKDNPQDGCPKIYGLNVCGARCGTACIKLLTRIHWKIWNWLIQVPFQRHMGGLPEDNLGLGQQKIGKSHEDYVYEVASG